MPWLKTEFAVSRVLYISYSITMQLVYVGGADSDRHKGSLSCVQTVGPLRQHPRYVCTEHPLNIWPAGEREGRGKNCRPGFRFLPHYSARCTCRNACMLPCVPGQLWNLWELNDGRGRGQIQWFCKGMAGKFCHDCHFTMIEYIS